jgi:hypothetical protein
MTDAPDGGPNKRRPERDRLLIDLGADLRTVRTEVHGLGADVQRLRADVRETAGYVAEAIPRLEDVETTLAEVRGQLDQLTAEEPEPANPPIEWPALTAEDAAREWDSLAEWIDGTLVPWLQITRAQLPDPWPFSRRAVFELLWLRTCYRQAYMKKSHPTAAAEWHTRWLDAALENVRKAVPEGWDQPAGEQPPAAPAASTQQPQQPQQPGYPPAAAGSGTEPWKQYAQQPQQPAPQPVRQYQQESWRDLLATREHWHGAWQQAKQRDLEWRRERERRELEAARQRIQATPTSGNTST